MQGAAQCYRLVEAQMVRHLNDVKIFYCGCIDSGSSIEILGCYSQYNKTRHSLKSIFSCIFLWSIT